MLTETILRPSSRLVTGGLLAAVAVAMVSCGRDPQASVEPKQIPGVAKVGEAIISEAAFREILHQRARSHPEKLATLEQKEALLDELVRPEAIYAKARAGGFDRRPDIVEAVRKLIIAKFQEEEFRKLPKTAGGVSDEEVRVFYHQTESRYRSPAAVNGAVIFLGLGAKATGEKREERRAEAEAVLQQARTDDFGALAARHSDDQATRHQGGVTGWMTREDKSGAWEPAVVEAIFGIEEMGEFSPVVPTPRGFYIVKLIEKRAAGLKPLEQVREAIRYQMGRAKEAQRQREFLTAMKAGLDIQINRARLESISLTKETDTPPGTLGAQAAQAGQ